MNRKTFDAFLVTYDRFDHDFNLIREGVVQGFTTREDAFNYAMLLNQKAIFTDSRLIFKVEFKTYRKALKNQILASVSDDRFKRIFN